MKPFKNYRDSVGDLHWIPEDAVPPTDWTEVEFDPSALPDPNYVAPYEARRMSSYPMIGDQLDMLWHAMDADESKRLEPFYSTIKAIKDAHPKPTPAE